MASGQHTGNTMITPSSDEAGKLDALLQRDERRRQVFIHSLSKQHNEKTPTREDLEHLTHNQNSVEQQLQQQVNFYENALAQLHERTIEISGENEKLHEKMNKSVTMGDDDLSDEEPLSNTDSSRLKERLLIKSVDRAKSSIDVDDSLISVEEPGQITVETDYKLFPQPAEDTLEDTLDTADFSLGSEPGQVTGIVNNFVSRDDGRQKRVTFNVDRSALPIDDTNNVRTNPGEVKHTPSVIDRNVLTNSNTRKPTLLTLIGGDASEKLIAADHGLHDHGLHEEMKSMKDLYETKTKHLQLLLHKSKKQVENQQVEITKLKGELRIYRTPVRDGDIDNFIHSWRKPSIMSGCEKKLVQELLVERDELFEAIKRQQAIVAEGSRHETEAYYQVKKSCELVEQVHLEKQGAVVRVKQLEKDLQEYKEKYQTLLKSHQEELKIASNKIKQEVEADVENLHRKVEEQTINVSVLENQLEKCVREKVDLKSELDKFGVHSASELVKSNAMVEDAQKELMEALKRQTLAEHETEQIRSDTRFKEKRRQQEIDQRSVEVKELKRRLHITEENLTRSQQSQLVLTNQLNASKQQLQQTISQHALMAHTFEEKKKRLEEDAVQRRQDLTESLRERDKHYELAKEELTRLLDSQTHIVAQYQNECKEINERLCCEQKQHQNAISKLTNKCDELTECVDEAFDKEQKSGVLLDSYKQRTESTEQELKQKKEMVMVLMSKQNAVLRDRYLLSKEIELLKSQLHTVT